MVEPEIPNLWVGGSIPSPRAYGIPGHMPGEYYDESELRHYFDDPEHSACKPAWTSVYSDSPVRWILDQVNLRRYFKVSPW